jgi:tetratricopeptide (TPR) repeat protein
MARARIGLACTLIAALALSTSRLAADRPKDEPALKQQALALNNVTGDEPIKGEIRHLLEDPKETRKLIGVAVEMARDKNQPFNYNGAFILGSAALVLKEFDAARTFYLVCAEQAGKLQSAQKLLQAYNGLMGVIDLLDRDKKYEKSGKLAQEFLEMLEKQGVSAAFKVEALSRMDRALVKQGKAAEATKLVDDMVKARPNDWHILELKASHERLLKNHAAATKLYTEILAKVESDDALEKGEKQEKVGEVRLALIQLYTQLGKADQALQQVEELAKGRQDNWAIRELRGEVQAQTGRLADAAKTYEELITQVGKDERIQPDARKVLQKQWRYVLSGVYVDLDQVDKAAAQLKTLLEQDPDNPAYNNDLGYIWADHDKNLDQAERMIRKALDEDRKRRMKQPDFSADADKDNAAYVDSLGWVLFKKKNYKEAKKYLLNAVKADDPPHIEIMDHLGDVHMALGEKVDAIAVWKKSLTVETSSKREKDRKAIVEKKLKAVEDKNVKRNP